MLVLRKNWITRVEQHRVSKGERIRWGQSGVPCRRCTYLLKEGEGKGEVGVE